MIKKRKVGIIGCGTIGSALAKILEREFRRRAAVVCLCDHRREKALALQKKLKRPARLTDLPSLIRQSDLIIEAASTAVVPEALKLVEKYGKEMLLMSVGGLLQPSAQPILSRGRLRLWVPSGALGGIDAVLGGAESRIRTAKLITRKPPAGLREAAYFKTRPFPDLKGDEAECVFKGTAAEAIRHFPQNINVAAVLSLAGIGASKTRVEIWISPAYRFNEHEINVEGDFGQILCKTRNVPSPDNPKTSALAIYSATATLRKIFSSVRIGT